MLFTNHSWEWGWQNSGWGTCQNKIDSNWQLIPLPLPLLYISPPSSCLIMLLCVCLSVCILCVKECVFLRSLCNVCVALILVFPLTIPPNSSPLLLSSPSMVKHPPPLDSQPNLIYLSIIFVFLHSTSTRHLSYSTLTTHHFHPHIHSLIHPFTHLLGFLLPSSNPLPSLYFTSLVSRSSLSLPPSPCPLRSPPPFLPSSLFHTVLCASLSLAGLLLGGWEFVCTQVPAEHPLHPGSQPGSAYLLLILLLLLLSLPFSLAISSPFTFLCPLYMTPHTTSVPTALHPPVLLPHLPLSFPPCWKHTALRFPSAALTGYFCLKYNWGFLNYNSPPFLSCQITVLATNLGPRIPKQLACPFNEKVFNIRWL